MTTIVERGSSNDSSALGIVLIVLVLLGLAAGIGYTQGFFSGPTSVIEKNNTTTIEHKTVVVPAPEPAATPAP